MLNDVMDVDTTDQIPNSLMPILFIAYLYRQKSTKADTRICTIEKIIFTFNFLFVYSLISIKISAVAETYFRLIEVKTDFNPRINIRNNKLPNAKTDTSKNFPFFLSTNGYDGLSRI